MKTTVPLVLGILLAACGTTGTNGGLIDHSDKPAAASLPTAPSDRELAALCDALYDSEAGAECQLVDSANVISGVAVMQVTAVQADFSHLLMADEAGTWHAVLELPDNGDEQMLKHNGTIKEYHVEHEVKIDEAAGAPMVMLTTSQAATFQGADGVDYKSSSLQTTWCGWQAAGPKCCGGVTTEANIVGPDDAPLAKWKLNVSLAGGQATVTKVDGVPVAAAVAAVGTHAVCKFPVSAKAAFKDVYGGIVLE